MKNTAINAADYHDILEIHEALARDLEFPDYYGKNLDALHDVLTEPDDEIRIEISLKGLTDPAMTHAILDMINVIMDAEEENQDLELIVRQ